MVAVLHSTDWKDRIFTIQRCKNAQKDQLGVNLKGPSLQWKEIACFPYHQQGPRNSGINCQRRKHSQQGFWTNQMQNQRHPQAQNWHHHPKDICLCISSFSNFPYYLKHGLQEDLLICSFKSQTMESTFLQLHVNQHHHNMTCNGTQHLEVRRKNTKIVDKKHLETRKKLCIEERTWMAS